MSADDLARRLVESPRWRWLDGCLDHRGWRYHAPTGRWLDDDADWLDGAIGGITDTARPALTADDPATEGCLLRLAREAWAARGGRVHVGPSSVAVFGHGRDPQWWDGPPGEALAHAILAAGEVRDA